MKIIFAHDHPFYYSGGLHYSSGGLPSSVWQRYLAVFKTITVVGRNRGQLSKSDKGYTLSSTEEVSFHLMPNLSSLKGLLLRNSDVAQQCEELVATHDAVIARLPSRLGRLFVDEAIKQSKPYAVEVVGCAWDALWNYGNIQGKLYAPISTLAVKRTVAKAPFALYVTENFLQRRYPCKTGHTTFCSNVEIPVVANNILEKRLEKISSVTDKKILGLIANYSSKYKGIDIAIKAFSHINHKLDNWELQIMGSGDPTAYIKLAEQLSISNHVKFIGSLPSGQPVYDWLDTIDIYLQPSLTEGLPRALVEAMSRGCPALASNIAGIPELLQPEQMIKAGDYIALAEKITRLASDNDAMITLAKQNYEKAKNYYKPVLDKRRTDFWKTFHDYALTYSSK